MNTLIIFTLLGTLYEYSNFKNFTVASGITSFGKTSNTYWYSTSSNYVIDGVTHSGSITCALKEGVCLNGIFGGYTNVRYADNIKNGYVLSLDGKFVVVVNNIKKEIPSTKAGGKIVCYEEGCYVGDYITTDFKNFVKSVNKADFIHIAKNVYNYAYISGNKLFGSNDLITFDNFKNVTFFSDGHILESYKNEVLEAYYNNGWYILSKNSTNIFFQSPYSNITVAYDNIYGHEIIKDCIYAYTDKIIYKSWKMCGGIVGTINIPTPDKICIAGSTYYHDSGNNIYKDNAYLMNGNFYCANNVAFFNSTSHPYMFNANVVSVECNMRYCIVNAEKTYLIDTDQSKYTVVDNGLHIYSSSMFYSSYGFYTTQTTSALYVNIDTAYVIPNPVKGIRSISRTYVDKNLSLFSYIINQESSSSSSRSSSKSSSFKESSSMSSSFKIVKSSSSSKKSSSSELTSSGTMKFAKVMIIVLSIITVML